jgi:hypothetical protein
MNICIRAFDKFILSMLNLRNKDSEREPEKDERSTAPLCARRPATPIPQGRE